MGDQPSDSEGYWVCGDVVGWFGRCSRATGGGGFGGWFGLGGVDPVGGGVGVGRIVQGCWCCTRWAWLVGGSLCGLRTRCCLGGLSDDCLGWLSGIPSRFPGTPWPCCSGAARLVLCPFGCRPMRVGRLSRLSWFGSRPRLGGGRFGGVSGWFLLFGWTRCLSKRCRIVGLGLLGSSWLTFLTLGGSWFGGGGFFPLSTGMGVLGGVLLCPAWTRCGTRRFGRVCRRRSGVMTGPATWCLRCWTGWLIVKCGVRWPVLSWVATGLLVVGFVRWLVILRWKGRWGRFGRSWLLGGPVGCRRVLFGLVFG
ncbi:hypothetical protein F4560_007863 [Saccharothrix ecbatanensis]|uniref:Uncharacterized protein n=1 Tax=Saccharothrix ecbatanensis TaxID=1105145 RepID=A0A7W9HTB3_9PSEU|nr:hypothetical protein [Saccharothrix ecbatanensis]